MPTHTTKFSIGDHVVRRSAILKGVKNQEQPFVYRIISVFIEEEVSYRIRNKPNNPSQYRQEVTDLEKDLFTPEEAKKFAIEEATANILRVTKWELAYGV